jgi:hypothetical protein
METAYIKGTVQTNALGKRESITYEWEGKSPYVRASHGFLYDLVSDYCPETLQLGPYRLLKVEDEPWLDTVLYVRSDRFGALRVALYKSTRLLDLIYRRLIITLAVWRLADFHEATVPTWKDIRALKRFSK